MGNASTTWKRRSAHIERVLPLSNDDGDRKDKFEVSFKFSDSPSKEWIDIKTSRYSCIYGEGDQHATIVAYTYQKDHQQARVLFTNPQLGMSPAKVVVFNKDENIHLKVVRRENEHMIWTLPNGQRGLSCRVTGDRDDAGLIALLKSSCEKHDNVMTATDFTWPEPDGNADPDDTNSLVSSVPGDTGTGGRRLAPASVVKHLGGSGSQTLPSAQEPGYLPAMALLPLGIALLFLVHWFFSRRFQTPVKRSRKQSTYRCHYPENAEDFSDVEPEIDMV